METDKFFMAEAPPPAKEEEGASAAAASDGKNDAEVECPSSKRRRVSVTDEAPKQFGKWKEASRQ